MKYLLSITALGFVTIFLFFAGIQSWFLLGSKVTLGIGQYTGTILETRSHGIFFKTGMIELKTGGYTSKIEDFCIKDENIYNELASMPRSKEVTITYKSKLATPSWDCASEDSNDIVTSVKVEN